MLMANKTTARASLVSCIMTFQRQNTKKLYIQLRILQPSTKAFEDQCNANKVA